LEQKLRKKKLWTISVSESSGSVDRHTLDVDRHKFWPKKVHDVFKFTEVEFSPEDFPICIISP